MARIKRPNRKQLRKCCSKCFNPFAQSQLRRVDPYTLLCPKCLESHAAPKRKAKEPGPEMRFYVLQVEPGTDSKVRQELLKQVKVQCLERLFGKVVIPRTLQDGLVRPAGDVLAEGVCETVKQAVWAAEDAAYTLLLGDGHDPADRKDRGDDLRAAYRFPAHQDPKSGKWVWKVRTKEDLVRKVIPVKKYPGYVIVQMHYDHDSGKLLDGLRYKGAWGLLLRPVVRGGHLTEVTESKRGGWLWKVRHPETGEVVEKGKEGREENAKLMAEQTKERLEAFNPVALKSEEAAEILVAQKAVNQIYKDKEELNRAVVNFKAGDAVNVVGGAFKGCTGTVAKVDGKKDSSDPEVIVDVTILGRLTPVLVKFWEVKRV